MNNTYRGLDPNQKNSIIQYYRTPDRSPGRAQVVKWSSKEGQFVRFRVLSSIGGLAGKSILDVGCGLGDFFHYLRKTAGIGDYTGIDLVPEFISQAKINYPDGKFYNTDLDGITKKYDYVLTSGSLNKKISGHKSVYLKMVEYMYGLSNCGAGFNMLNAAAHPDDETYSAFVPEEILAFCKSFAREATLVTGYLKHDFTIFLYH